MSEPENWKPNGRPLSTIALNFSATLDDLFKLGSVTDLESVVEQKNREVQTQKSQLEDLDARLRQADEKLRKLELKHKRMSRHLSGKPSGQDFYNTSQNSDTDTDASSSPSEGSQNRQL